MEIVQKVKDAVQSAFPDVEADVDYSRRSGKVSGVLVWQGFDSLDQLDRQKKLWDVLRSKLGPDATKVSFIFTYTQREHKAMMAH